jgi:putative DNA primase/helicase
MTAGLHEAARGYAARGINVFPLHFATARGGTLMCSCGNPGCGSNAAKHPYARLAPRGLLNATIDRRLIDRWWGPGVPYNIGIRAGKPSGIVAVDVDPRHGGDETLADLERRFGALPLTWRFLTGGGGEHILFRHNGNQLRNDCGQALGAGIDFRGDGGYVVAPPSRYVSGRFYAISVDHHPDEVPLAELPLWLAMKLQPAGRGGAPAAALPETWRKLLTEGVSEGSRNTAIARLAGLLLRCRLDPFVALDLIRCWNASRCRPPLSETELVHTVDSIAARELSRRGAAHE